MSGGGPRGLERLAQRAGARLSDNNQGGLVASFINHRTWIVQWGQCDPAGVVFNSRFFEVFDQSTWLLFEAALGVKAHELSKTFDIFGIPLVDARANFLKPAKFGDVIEIASRVAEFRRSSFEIEHTLSVNDELAVEGVETRVWAARDKASPESFGAVAIPTDVIAKFQAG